MGFHKTVVTPENKEHIELLVLRAFNDVRISKELSINYHVVAKVTTDYWHKKMKKAYDWYNY